MVVLIRCAREPLPVICGQWSVVSLPLRGPLFLLPFSHFCFLFSVLSAFLVSVASLPLVDRRAGASGWLAQGRAGWIISK